MTSALPQSSLGKAVEVPSLSMPAGASDASPRGPLDDLANASQPQTPGISTGSAVPAATTEAGANVVSVPSSAQANAQANALETAFNKDLSSLIANLSSGLLSLKERQQLLTQTKPDPTVKVPDEKKAPELISVPKISPDEWVHLFETTGLCQAYDLESEHPTPAGIPLFIVQHGREEKWTDEKGTKHDVPEKPAFIVDDRIRRVEEETYTERRRYLAESGFSSADLALVVPYVQASVQSSKLEKEQSQQASKTVFVTTRDEYPRCQLNITASVHSGYLGINPRFSEEVQLVSWKEIEENNQRKEKVKRLKEAIAEVYHETPVETILEKYKDDVAEEILDTQFDKYKAWLTGWEARQTNTVRKKAGSSPSHASVAPNSTTTGGDSRESGAEGSAKGGSSLVDEAGANLLAKSNSSGGAGSLEERREIGAAPGQVDSGQESALCPGSSSLPVDCGLGKEEEADLKGVSGERGRLDTETGATQTGEEESDGRSGFAGLEAESAARGDGPPLAVRPENGGGGAPGGAGKTRAAKGVRRLMRVLTLGRMERPPKAGAAEVREVPSPRPSAATPEKGKTPEDLALEKADFKELVRTHEFLPLAWASLAREQKKLEPERERIVVAMQDIIVRFGAVWIERITLGGQHISTRTEKLVSDTSSRERTRTQSASIGGHEAGAAVRLSASAGKSKMAHADMSENTRSSEVHATGGDTITFRQDNDTDWVHSIRATQNWRIIRYRKMQELSTAPGLDDPVDSGEIDKDKEPVTVRRLLRERLKVVAEDVAELEGKKDPPRRYLGHNLRRDLKGYWYGFDCALQEGAFNPGPSILQLKVNKTIEFEVLVGDDVQAMGARFHGVGQDSTGGIFNLEGYLLEVKGFDNGYDGSLYEPSGVVRMQREYDPSAGRRSYAYSGHLDSTGMHGLWRRSDKKTGSWTLAPVLCIPVDTFDDNWTFTEREIHFNESQRRWILPAVSHSLDPKSAHLAKRVDPELVKGPWLGYLLPRGTCDLSEDPRCDLMSGRFPDVDFRTPSFKLLQNKRCRELGLPVEHEDLEGDNPENNDEEDKGFAIDWGVDSNQLQSIGKEDDNLKANSLQLDVTSFPAGDLQPKRAKLVIENCVLAGGRAGWQRFTLAGTLREDNVQYTFTGFIQQVPANPKENVGPVCPHDYPYLGKVDLRLTRAGTLPSINRNGKGRRYRGHLDHLGMHGFVTEDGKSSSDLMESHVATFGFMPVTKQEVGKRAWWSYLSRKKSAVV